MVNKVTWRVHEIIEKASAAKTKAEKIKILQEHQNNWALKDVLRGTFDDSVQWLLPEGKPPYKVNEAPVGTEHTWLKQEVKRMFHFLKGGNPQVSQMKRDTMVIQMLEGLCAEEAQLLLWVKDKELNKHYKGLTANLVKEAFGWNDDFMRKNA